MNEEFYCTIGLKALYEYLFYVHMKKRWKYKETLSVKTKGPEVSAAQRWYERNREEHNAYMREYAKEKRKLKGLSKEAKAKRSAWATIGKYTK